MRGRIQIHLKALAFSLSAVFGILFATFFFYDGPLEFPHIEPLAQATVNTLADADTQPVADDEPYSAVSNPLAGILPSGFHAQWQQVSLDQNRIHLQLLKTPFMLSQTHHQSGSEAFQYASYLFDQMAKSVKSPQVAQELQSLSLQAQTMGNAISQADAFQFSGVPTTNMNHLQVRSSILYYLSGLNASPLVSARYNQHGKLLTQALGSPNQSGGEILSSFMNQAEAVLSHPAAKAYPQTMQLVKQESELLKKLASHLTLRWETTLDCNQSCGNVAVYLRVYTHQTLPEQTLAAVTL
jgi:hypothetical protein